VWLEVKFDGTEPSGPPRSTSWALPVRRETVRIGTNILSWWEQGRDIGFLILKLESIVHGTKISRTKNQ